MPARPPLDMVTTVALVVLLLGGCGSARRTALAIDGVRWRGDAQLELTTECATDVEVESGRDSGGSELAQVTIWGKPSVGRCEPSVTVTVPPGTTRIVDGTTSMVVDLPARPR